jgi:heat shock protein HslJ
VEASIAMRSFQATLALLAVAGMILAACGGSGATPRPTVPTGLPGTEWTLGLQAGTAPAANARPTIVFGSDGSVTGFGGCNNYSGTYVTSGAQITVAGLETQPAAFECAPEVIDFQQQYLDALASATTWSMADAGDAAPSGAVVLSPIKLSLGGIVELIYSLD